MTLGELFLLLLLFYVAVAVLMAAIAKETVFQEIDRERRDRLKNPIANERRGKLVTKCAQCNHEVCLPDCSANSTERSGGVQDNAKNSGRDATPKIHE